MMPRPSREPGIVPARQETSLLQKMQNSGNEAKKWLKTKEVTFLNDAQFAHFACKLAPNRAQKAPRNHILCKTKSGFPVGGEVGTVTNSRLQRSAAGLHKCGGPTWIGLKSLKWDIIRRAMHAPNPSYGAEVDAMRRLALRASEGRAEGPPLARRKWEKKT